MSRFEHGWPDTRRVWFLRIILTVVLLALAIGLGYVHIHGTYKPIMNCHGVLVRGMKFDPWICDGFTIAGFDVGPWEIGPYDIDTLIAGKVRIHYKLEYHNEGYQIPGPAKNIDGPLEWVRGATVWTILAFFLIASLVVTIVVKIIGPPIIRLVTLDPGEWKKLLGTLRTWAVILALFLLLFLIGVWRGGGLAPTTLSMKERRSGDMTFFCTDAVDDLPVQEHGPAGLPEEGI